MPQEKLKVVFDCNVYLQAFLSTKGVATKCKKLVEDGLIELYISRDILNEVKDVLARPEVIVKFPHFTPESFAVFIEEINEIAVFKSSVNKHFELPRDKKDEPYINLAVEVEADFIITWDRDLLELMTGIDMESKEFRQRFRPLKIIAPIEFMKIIEDKDLSLKH